MPKKKASREEGAVLPEVTLPLKYIRDPKVPSLFANHLVIQYDGEEFHLGFFEMKPPLVVGNPEEAKQQLEQIEHAEAHCVANIVVSKGRMKRFAEAISRNVTRVFPEGDK